MKNVFLLILHFGDPKITIECLESIVKLEREDISLSILVIDNGGWEEKFKLPKFFEGKLIEVVHTEQNLGYSGGLNMGIRLAQARGADYVAVLNNDTEVGKSLVVELLLPFKKDPRIGMTVPKIYFAEGREYHKDRYKKEDLGKVIWYAGGKTDWKNVISSHVGVNVVDHGQFNREQDTDFATGACFMISKEALEKVGLFNGKYFLYYEDGDLSMRVKRAGFRILFVPGATLHHKNAASSSSGSVLQDYYITRNRFLFGFTYAPLRSRVALIRESIRLLFTGRKWQKKGVWDFYMGRFGKGSFG